MSCASDKCDMFTPHWFLECFCVICIFLDLSLDSELPGEEESYSRVPSPCG
jgi:hypothetical protein